jgi:glutamate-1-semialdehyde 2,1-aminomutase
MPVGAYGGSREFMEQLAPLGPIYQAGTLSGNPVAMAAGAATLKTLFEDKGAAYAQLETLGGLLENGVSDVLRRLGVEWSVVRIGSILWLALQDGDPPTKYEDIRPESAETYAALHRALLDRGVSLAPSAYEVMFVSLAHDRGVIEQTIDAFEGAVREIT